MYEKFCISTTSPIALEDGRRSQKAQHNPDVRKFFFKKKKKTEKTLSLWQESSPTRLLGPWPKTSWSELEYEVRFHFGPFSKARETSGAVGASVRRSLWTECWTCGTCWIPRDESYLMIPNMTLFHPLQAIQGPFYCS
jgi:hypothetical protein